MLLTGQVVKELTGAVEGREVTEEYGGGKKGKLETAGM